ncbi:esterase [Rubrivivax gelatinosus]|uniref:alpha/beta hydrolase n=1 Tax=Rubrivivax gelatinosus TaxID=28068 RepID=UPI001906E39E|nr:alpha/beta hydrolase [Rubrivivax gelatinosus]MBK1615587.1 esterase [Rubrivivax gelatinosus]
MNRDAGGWLRRREAAEPPPHPAGTRVDADLAYGRWPAQRLDVYRPAQAQSAPVLVVVHGGAWITGDKQQPQVVGHKLAHWGPKGWIVVAINYRRLPWADPREQAIDVARALAYVQREAAGWGGDTGRIVVLGHSTGAHLAALVLADTALAAAAGCVAPAAAVLVDSAALDVVEVMDGAHLPLHDRAFGDQRAAWELASPWHRAATLQAAPPPVLLLCSSLREDSTRQSERFAARLVERGGRARSVALPLTHAELNEQLGQPGEATNQVDAFLAECFAPPAAAAG